MMYESYSAIPKTLPFFIGINFRKMKKEIFPENKLLIIELLIHIFCLNKHTQLHLQVSFTKFSSFKVIKVICTSPESQLGYI